MKTKIPLAIQQLQNDMANFFFIAQQPCGWKRTDLVNYQQTDDSATVGSVLIGAAALTYWLLLLDGAVMVDTFTHNPEIEHLAHPGSRELTVSLCGSLAGGLIITAYRRSVIAGALIAVVLIHAAALIGVSLVTGRWELALEGAERFSVDALIVMGSCGLIFGAKQVLVHRRKPIV